MEPQIAEPKLLPNPSPTSAIPNLKPLEKEETPSSDFMLDFEDELFNEYGNISNYHTMRRPRKSKELSSEEPLDHSEEAFLKKTTKEIVSVVSNEWLEESELSSDVICLDSSSISISRAPMQHFFVHSYWCIDFIALCGFDEKFKMN